VCRVEYLDAGIFDLGLVTFGKCRFRVVICGVAYGNIRLVQPFTFALHASIIDGG
jgi:hypothetical protein